MEAAFDEELFETRLEGLKDTQESIQQLSSWCLQHRRHHKKIILCWLNVFKRVRVEHRLTLFYLANDVIQYSKRKRYEFVESWATALQRATTMVRDEKVKSRISRMFGIWQERDIYSEEYISDLHGLLNIRPPRKTQPLSTDASTDDFQSASLVQVIRECVDLSTNTDNSFKKLPKAPVFDMTVIKQHLKDKTHADDVERELERYAAYADAYCKNLQVEMKSRRRVLKNLEEAMRFYAAQRGEVKVVVNAYKHFGSRIKSVKKRLDELLPKLMSPMPSPDIDAPSPEPDADLKLPGDNSPVSISIFNNTINGYSSYLDGGKLPFDIDDFKREEPHSKASSQPIEVIGARADEEAYASSINDYYKEGGSTSLRSFAGGGGGGDVAIPGLNPMPVPPVDSGYTSLARAAEQFGAFGGSGSASGGGVTDYGATLYSSVNNYQSSGGVSGGTNSYTTATSGGGAMSGATSAIAGTDSGGGKTKDNFEWDQSLVWTTLGGGGGVGSSHSETPGSPPSYDRAAQRVVDVAPLEYSEQGNGIMGARDVDHRQLHFPPFKIDGIKDKALDIDHRNLISLTGSPGRDGEKKRWRSSQDQDYRTNSSGDVDYRALQAVGGDSAKGSTASQKGGATTQQGEKDEADMVVDMDMSDEELDEIFREVNADLETTTAVGPGEQVNSHDPSGAAPASMMADPSAGDYMQQQGTMAWAGYGGGGGIDMQQQQQQQDWNQMQMAWPSGHDAGGGPSMCVPPPPRPPVPLQFAYPNNGGYGGEYAGPRGVRAVGPRDWNPPHMQMNQYRGFGRNYNGNNFRGGGRGGGPGGPMRGGQFRGKYRGNPWI